MDVAEKKKEAGAERTGDQYTVDRQRSHWIREPGQRELIDSAHWTFSLG
jgi:hypothetical protein